MERPDAGRREEIGKLLQKRCYKERFHRPPAVSTVGNLSGYTVVCVSIESLLGIRVLTFNAGSDL